MEAEPAQLPLGKVLPGLRPKATAFLVVVVALALLASVYHWARKEVVLTIVGEETMVLKTFKDDVAGLLVETEIEVSDYDVVEPEPDTPLTEGMTVSIRRAQPVVAVVGGERVAFSSAQPTVGAALEQAGIDIGPLDRVTPGLREPLPDSDEIIVTRVREELVTEEVPLSYQVRRQPDGSLPKGQTKTVTAGEVGLVRQVLRLVYENGVKVAEELVSKEVLKEPVAQVVAVGTQAVLSRGGENIRYREMRTMEATAYSPDPRENGGNTHGLTATGIPARRGVVAVDPRVIPLGTKLYIEGYGQALAADVGGAIKGNIVDLCFDTHEEAIRFGRRQVKVYIVQ